MRRSFNACIILLVTMMLAGFVSCGNLSNSTKAPPLSNNQPALPTPTGFTVTESKTDYNQVNLTWAEVEGAEKYEIFQSTRNNFSTSQTPEKTLSRTFLTMEMNFSGTYYFCVRAYKKGEDGKMIYSDFSSVQEYTYNKPETYSPPKYVSAVQSDEHIKQVWISWQQNGADRYYVYYHTEDDPEHATEYEHSTIGYRSQVIYLSDAGTYYFWVRAANSDGTEKGGFSQVASCYFDPSTIPLTAPKQVSARQESGKNSIEITWEENGAYRYKVYYNTTDNKTDAQESIVSTLTNSHSIKFKETGTYYFWVVAEDPDGNRSDYSQSVSCYFKVIKPEAPTNVSAKADGQTVTISYMEKIGFIYNFYYNTVNDSKTAKKTDLFYFDLDGSGTYYFWVTATDSDGIESDFSNVATCEITID